MKERIVSIFLLLLAAVTVWAIIAELPHKEYARPSADFSDATQVADEVIRLHILADSDSEKDQSVKLALRDILLPYLNAATSNAATKEEAMALLKEQCNNLTQIANAALLQLGADYTATVSVESLYFPIRIYGSQTYLSEDAIIFPPGYYDSVQVVLGTGQGHNWWCLAYPSLCFIDATYDYVPKDSDMYKLKISTVEKHSLEQLFYGKELSSVTPGNPDDEITVYFGSKLWELIINFFS